MERIRPFTPGDIPEVAALWRKVFLNSPPPTPPSFESYYREIFFTNPWASDRYPSLVYENDKGIAGFLGVLPRPMVFRGRPIQAAVGTQFLVDKSLCRGFPALRLMKEFLAGPQDLSFTDGGRDVSAAVWTAAGAQVAHLYCLEWTRTLRPVQFALQRLSGSKKSHPALRLLRPIGWGLDNLVNRLQLGPYRHPLPEETETEASDEDLLTCIARFSEQRALRPDYDQKSLHWLLGQTAEATQRGPLRRAVVRDARGEIAGWYICHIQPGGVSQVLQLGGTDKAAGLILRNLTYHAWQQGSLALTGQVDSRMLRTLSDNWCPCRCLSQGVTVHSRNPEILNAIHSGDAFLTRLEGEWWVRFCDAAS